VLAFFSISLSGCFYSKATREMNAAERSLSDLKAQGGEKLVPYDVWGAEEFLENAKMEVNESY
jgi:hypothetical protein